MTQWDAEHLPQYTPTTAVLDRAGTQACGLLTTNPNVACGDYAVNTIQPAYQPFRGSPQLPAQTGPTIGDELSAAGVTWAWYSGGWSNADGDVNAPGWTNGSSGGNLGYNFVYSSGSADTTGKWYCPNKVFQFHHQPFNYYANYAPGTPGRAHLQDEQAFINAAQGSRSECNLPSVSFIKPIGLENEAPRLHERGPRERPPAASGHDQQERVQARTPWSSSPTTSSVASGTTSRLPDRAAPQDRMTFGAWHPHSGVDHLAAAARAVRGRPHAVRHDLDSRHHRAPVRPRGAFVA